MTDHPPPAAPPAAATAVATAAAATDFAEKPTLTGEKVMLRPYRLDEDLDALREMLVDPEIGRLTGSVNGPEGMPWDADAERRMLEWFGTRNAQTDRLDLAVVDLATGACVGEAVLHEWDRGNRGCRFRIALTAAGQGRGLGSEAVRLIVGHGFERLGLHRIELGVFTFNPRARRAYEKAGFVAEGVERQTLRYDGEWYDSVTMSILAPEWERHRGRPAALDPAAR